MVTYVIGLAGSGKTTLAAKFAHNAFKKGLKVYSNVPILGALQLDVVNDCMNYDISHGIMIIDESAIDFNSRNFAKFPPNVNEFVRLHRHAFCDIYIFSQNYMGADKIFRDLADCVVLLRKCKSLRGYGFVRFYYHDIIPPDKDNPDFHDVFKLRLIDTRLMRYGNRYTKLFDSFEMPLLPQKDWLPWECTNRFRPSSQQMHPKLWSDGQLHLKPYVQYLATRLLDRAKRSKTARLLRAIKKALNRRKKTAEPVYLDKQ